MPPSLKLARTEDPTQRGRSCFFALAALLSWLPSASPFRLQLTDRVLRVPRAPPGAGRPLWSTFQGSLGGGRRDPLLATAHGVGTHHRLAGLQGITCSAMLAREGAAGKKVALVTGANRGLGLGLVSELAKEGFKVLACCRDARAGDEMAGEMREAGHDVSAFQLDVSCEQRSVEPVHSPRCKLICHVLTYQAVQFPDLALDAHRHVCISASIGRLASAVQDGQVPVPDLLINNAGVCIEGGDRAVLADTLKTNLFGARRIIQALSPAMASKRSGAICFHHLAKSGELTLWLPFENSGCSVINISSGEGELVYLCSALQERLSRVETLDELDSLLEWCLECVRAPLLSSFLDALAAHSAPRFPQATVGEELAFGATPAYSVSKAALNCLTRLLAAQGVAEVRAVCPGDVDTPMCMLDSKEGVLSPGNAAKDVLWVAMHREACPPGRFYRAREEIPW